MKPEYATIVIKRKKDSRAQASFQNVVFLIEGNSENLKTRLKEIVTVKNTILEIDLKGIGFIDNSVIDTLNLVSRLGKRYSSRMILTNVSKELMELINLIRIHSVFDIREVVPEASTMKVA